jgi:Nuclease-related domain
MWGRRPGENVRERIEELDAERAMWARGEQGEVLVGEELDRLPHDEWWVFHSIPRGGSGTDIDHLVIGVGGIYTINTKNVSADVWVAERVLMVGGTKTNYLPVATSEARDAARRITTKVAGTVDVRPVLVFTRPVTIRAMPNDVAVLEAETVRTWLEHQPRVLTPWQAYELVLVANQQSTWT